MVENTLETVSNLSTKLVNAVINQCTSHVKVGYSPYCMYYGQKLHSAVTFVMGESAKFAETEYGVQVAKKLLQK